MYNHDDLGIVIDIISSCTNIAALFVVSVIAVSLFQKRDLQPLFLLRFWITLDIAAIFVQITCSFINILFRRLFKHDSAPELSSFFALGIAYIIQITCVLGALVTRYHVTFRDSMFEMSTSTKYKFIAVTVVLAISMLAGIICAAVLIKEGEKHSDVWWQILAITSLTWASTYIVSAWWTVCRFCQNLLRLAKLRQRTIEAANQDIELDRAQRDLVHVISKYITLFAVAATSSTLTLITAQLMSRQLLWPKEHSSQSAVMSIDSMVNVTCLYLQYSFVGDRYRKYCSNLDVLCRKRFSANLIQSMSPEPSLVHDTAPSPSSRLDSKQEGVRSHPIETNEKRASASESDANDDNSTTLENIFDQVLRQRSLPDFAEGKASNLHNAVPSNSQQYSPTCSFTSAPEISTEDDRSYRNQSRLRV